MPSFKSLREFLLQRRIAYNQIFDRNNRFTEVVLADLANFCRANQSTFNTDPSVQALLEGRREVWLRIQHHLKLTEEEMWDLYAIKKSNVITGGKE